MKSYYNSLVVHEYHDSVNEIPVATCDAELAMLKRAYDAEKRLASIERKQRDEAWGLLREVLAQDWNAKASDHLLSRIREAVTGRA